MAKKTKKQLHINKPQILTSTHVKIGKFRILTKEEVEADRCKAYPYIF